MIVGLMKRYIKVDVFQKVILVVKFLKLDFLEKKIFFEINKVDIGFVVVDKFKKLQGEKKVSDCQVRIKLFNFFFFWRVGY